MAKNLKVGKITKALLFAVAFFSMFIFYSDSVFAACETWGYGWCDENDKTTCIAFPVPEDPSFPCWYEVSCTDNNCHAERPWSCSLTYYNCDCSNPCGSGGGGDSSGVHARVIYDAGGGWDEVWTGGSCGVGCHPNCQSSSGLEIYCGDWYPGGIYGWWICAGGDTYAQTERVWETGSRAICEVRNIPSGYVCRDPDPVLGGGIDWAEGDCIQRHRLNDRWNNWQFYIIPIPPPTNLTASCPSPPGNTATVSWDEMPGVSYYSLRVDDFSNGWRCAEDPRPADCCTNPNPGDLCLDLNPPSCSDGVCSYTFSTTSDHIYNWWIHSRTSTGGWSAAAFANFNCIEPTPAPTSIPTPTPFISVDLHDAVGGPVSLEMCPAQCSDSWGLWSCAYFPADCVTASSASFDKPDFGAHDGVGAIVMPGSHVADSYLMTPNGLAIKDPSGNLQYIWGIDWTGGEHSVDVTLMPACSAPNTCVPAASCPSGSEHTEFYCDDPLDFCCEPHCTVSVSPITMNVGDSIQVPFSVEAEVGGTIDQVTFSLTDSGGFPETSIASVCETEPCLAPPGSDSYTDLASGFRAYLTAYNEGETYLNAEGVMVDEGNIICDLDPRVTVTADPVSAWWQVKDGDVMAGSSDNPNVDISSQIPSTITCVPPCNSQLITGEPGVAVAGGNVNTGSAEVVGWEVEGSPYSGKILSYSDFRNKLPAGVIPELVTSPADQSTFTTGGTEYPVGSGYYYYLHDGSSLDDLEIDGDINLATRKVILFAAKEEVNINGDVELTDGQGFFMIISDQNINIDQGVVSLEGIYVTDDRFATGTDGTDTDDALTVRGTVVAKQVNMQRKLADNSATPAEIFEFAPDQLMNFPSIFGEKRVRWKEVAP